MVVLLYQSVFHSHLIETLIEIYFSSTFGLETYFYKTFFIKLKLLQNHTQQVTVLIKVKKCFFLSNKVL